MSISIMRMQYRQRRCTWREFGQVVSLFGVCIAAGLALSSRPQLIAFGLMAVLAAAMVSKTAAGLGVFAVIGLVYGVLERTFGATSPVLASKELLLLGLLAAVTARHIRTGGQSWSGPKRPLAVWLGLALISGAVSYRDFHTAQGLRLTFEFVAVLFVAEKTMSAVTYRRLLYWVLPFVLANLLAAAWQTVVGVDGLVNAGYTYGRNVREIGHSLRAFGLMTFGIPFGHTMAVLTLAYIGLALNESGRRRLLASVGAASAGTGVLLSVNRTAFFGMVIGLLVLYRMRSGTLPSPLNSSRPSSSRVWMALSAAVLFAVAASLSGMQINNPVKDRSLQARLTIWSDFLQDELTLFGSGPGTAGSAAAAADTGKYIQTRTDSRIVVDNYYVTTLSQYGLVGLMCLLTTLMAVGRRLLRFARQRSEAHWIACSGIAVFAYFVLSMFSLNSWEDFPTPIFVWLVIGAVFASHKHESSTPAVGTITNCERTSCHA